MREHHQSAHQVSTTTKGAPVPSIRRALHGLEPAYQALLTDRYQHILPILLQLLRPRDILERNRAWPGVSPIGKEATRLLTVKGIRKARACIKAYAARHGENADDLWQLVRAYCRYGPIGLLDALPSSLPPLIADELQECADFHRLAKHPRTDAGIYIREILDRYADDLHVPRLPKFVARYAFATNRRIERWFYGESDATEAVAKTTRRLNLTLPYPNQLWKVGMTPLPMQCLLARRHPRLITPWLVWTYDMYPLQLMGFRLCPSRPTWRDVMLALRWSIWHYDTPSWKGRGAPDILLVTPQLDGEITEVERQALLYTHCRVVVDGNESPATKKLLASIQVPIQTYSGFPETFVDWLTTASEHSQIASQPSRLDLAGLRSHILDYLRDEWAETIHIVPTPSALAERQVSLPWSTGIAAVLFLPSGGKQAVVNGVVSPFGVLFDAVACGLIDGSEVEVRYDPDDARAIYLIYNGAHVAKAEARGFEHRTTWFELVDDPALFGATL